MKLEGIIVSVNYGDFLEHTIRENMPYFDRLVIVTSPQDKATQALCERLSISCVVTDCMFDRGQKFNKGMAINLGLGHLNVDGWVLHLDADIVLPHNFRRLLDHARLDRENIYGADRVNVYGWEAWQRLKNSQHNTHSYRYLVSPPPHPLGSRLVHEEFGYAPIGYFQLWQGAKRYPIHQGNAEHTDVLFSLQWPRKNRVLLPEVFVYHLDSNAGPSKMGENWNGRKSPQFGPKAELMTSQTYCPNLDEWKIN